MFPGPDNLAAVPPRQRLRRRHADGRPVTFLEDFRLFFVRGLSALLPTLITLWLLVWVWNFLWQNLGRHMIWLIRWAWLGLVEAGLMEPQPPSYIGRYWSEDAVGTRILGVILAIIAVYVVGVFVGNLIG